MEHDNSRPKELPRIERVFNHKLHPGGESWLIRTTSAEEENRTPFYKSQQIPTTTNPTSISEIELPPGIPLLVRDMDANPDGDEEKDIVRAFYNNVDYLVTQENGGSSSG